MTWFENKNILFRGKYKFNFANTKSTKHRAPSFFKFTSPSSFDSQRLDWQAKVLTDNPYFLFKKLLFAFLLLIISIPLNLLIAIIPTVLAFIYLVVVITSISSLKRNLIKHEIAKKYGWSFSPDVDSYAANALVRDYPLIFKPGDRAFVYDQILGSYTYKGVSREFYSGSYTYVVENNSTDNKSSTKYPNYFFAIKIEKKLKSTFLLYQESIFSRIGQKFHNKELDVESIKFNKIFAFKYPGKKDAHQINITKTLSPSVQLKLIELNKKGRSLNILFQDEVIIFLFKGKLLRRIKSKVLFGLKLAKEDLDLFDDYMISFNEIAGEIVSKI